MQTTPSAHNNVFIVEDSISIRERLAALLTEIEGVSVVGEADSPSAAVDGILRMRPDSVVLDIHLVNGSGIEVLREVHPRIPGIVFIVLTSHPDPQYRRICMQAGASYFLDKNTEFAKVGEVIAGSARRAINAPQASNA
jgi:two-component system, NarL family, response regulator DevR